MGIAPRSQSFPISSSVEARTGVFLHWNLQLPILTQPREQETNENLAMHIEPIQIKKLMGDKTQALLSSCN